jgi:integrase
LVARLREAHARNGRGVHVCSKAGKPWVVYDLSRRVSERIRSLGIEGTLHSLRHTYVTALASDPENDPKTVQRLARHKDIGTTFNVYAHAQAPRLRQAVGRLSLGRPLGR